MDFLDGNERFVLSVLRSSASSGVQDILSEQIQRDIREHMARESAPAPADAIPMLAAIYAGAIVSCGKWWILQEERPDKESVVRTFSDFVMRL